MDLKLPEPALVEPEGWRAIQACRVRLEMAVAGNDAPLAIGSAKDLVESVARVAALAAGGQGAPGNANFAGVVGAAHSALDRQAGKGITNSSDVRAIADSARKMVVHVSSARNDWGTGHGRAEMRSIEAELLTMVVGAAMLWCRWALTRLDHLVKGEPQQLISLLSGGLLSRRNLEQRMAAIVLPEQPADVQRALGAAFARRSRGGTFVARQVGIDEPSSSPDLAQWPEDYRLGAAEGIAISEFGHFTLTLSWLPIFHGLLEPLPPPAARKFLGLLAEEVRTSAPNPTLDAADLYALSQAVRASDLPGTSDSLADLADAIDPTED